MPNKPIAELTPEQAEAQRKYNRDAKRRSRENGHIEDRKPDTRKRNRAEYMREYRARKKAEQDD